MICILDEPAQWCWPAHSRSEPYSFPVPALPRPASRAALPRRRLKAHPNLSTLGISVVSSSVPRQISSEAIVRELDSSDILVDENVATVEFTDVSNFSYGLGGGCRRVATAIRFQMLIAAMVHSR